MFSRLRQKMIFAGALVGLLGSVQLSAQTPTAAVSPPPSVWSLVKQKTFPHYRVDVQQRTVLAKLPRVDATSVRITPRRGGVATELSGTWMTPDPREFVQGWSGGSMDMNGDGLEDLVLRNYSGGGHCCYDYTIYDLAPTLKKLGNVDLQDCGEQIRLEDLDLDKRMEIVACDARFTYLGELPYSESPFPPAVYSLDAQGYRRADQRFLPVFEADIRRQRQELAQGYRPAAALQIVIDYFLMGQETQGWQEFQKLYQGSDKDKIKQQLIQKLSLKGDAAPTPAPSVESDADVKDKKPESGSALPSWFKN